MKTPIRFAFSKTNSRSNKATQENLINMYAEKLPDGAVSSYVIQQCSGLTKQLELPNETSVKALHSFKGKLYAFTDKAIYSIGDTYTKLKDIELKGDRVSIANNGIQMAIVDGIKGYVYDGTTLTDITAQSGMYPSNTVTFQDGYFIFNRKGTGQFFISELYGTTTDPLDFATAESSPDDTVALISFTNQLWLFGTETTEIWYNSGDSLFPFSRISGAILQIGCHSPYSIAKGVSEMLFIGSDKSVYSVRSNSYVPNRVSTYAVEQYINNEPNAYGFIYTEFEHEFYLLHLPNAKKSFCYDLDTGLWHERQSPRVYTEDIVQFNDRHYSNCLCLFNGKNYVGSRIDGNVYYLDTESVSDNGTVFKRECTASPIFKDNEFLLCFMFELFADVTVTTNSDPKLVLSWSDDGIKFSKGVVLSMGKTGERHKRIIARRLGRFRERMFRVTITDDVKVSILNAYADLV